jgi:hypothetical protein
MKIVFVKPAIAFYLCFGRVLYSSHSRAKRLALYRLVFAVRTTRKTALVRANLRLLAAPPRLHIIAGGPVGAPFKSKRSRK